MFFLPYVHQHFEDQNSERVLTIRVPLISGGPSGPPLRQ